MKIWNKNICLTDRLPLLVIAIVLFSTFVLANVWTEPIVEAEAERLTVELAALEDTIANCIINVQRANKELGIHQVTLMMSPWMLTLL